MTNKISIVGEKVFTQQDQTKFAELSGDFNPLHVSDIYSRRTIYGKQLIHGINALLYGLSLSSQNYSANIEIKSLKCSFKKPFFLDSSVQVLGEADANQIRLDFFQDGLSKSKLSCHLGESSKRLVGFNPYIDGSMHWDERHPNDTSINFLKSYSQIETLNKIRKLDADSVYGESLLQVFDPNFIAHLLTFTREVGMKCPGTNALFAGLSMQTKDSEFGKVLLNDQIHFKTESLDNRFNLLDLNGESCYYKSSIQAFIRPSAVKQKALSCINDKVDSGAFATQKALVIGGSRGLGEITSKVLLAGGAEVLLTYNHGLDEANLILDEVLQFPYMSASICHLNVQNLSESAIANILDFSPTHVYYFPTPKILTSLKIGEFDLNLFDKFNQFYVQSFSKIVVPLLSKCRSHLFVPSTIFLEEPGISFPEYCSSKSMLEGLLDYFKKNFAESYIYHPRLPKILTDQTVSNDLSGCLDGLDTMLDCIEKFAELSGFASKNEV